MVEKLKKATEGIANYVGRAFSDDKTPSSVRWIALYLITIGAGLAFYGLHLKVDPWGLAALCGVFVGGAVTNQQLGKKQERLLKESELKNSNKEE
jgi:hypothetical protein